MRKWAKGTTRATLLTASFVALGAGPALADVTNGNDSLLGGNQINAPISVPVDLSGNSVALIGRALAGSTGGAAVYGDGGGSGGGSFTSGRHSVLGGNQINAPINVPINACGNSVALIGHALAGCRGGAGVYRTSGYGGGHHGRTDGRYSIGGGNQIHAPITAPVNVCGNTAALLGTALAGCHGGAGVVGGGGGGGFAGRTSGRHSVLGGNQIHAPINAPINVCGNAVGNALAGCAGGALVHGVGYGPGWHGGWHGTDGRYSIGGGNQAHAPINVPVDACGNAAAVIGHALGGCLGSLPGAGGYPGGYHHIGWHQTDGRYSIGGGNQIHVPINAPINVCGNAVGILGHALGSCGGYGGGYGGGYEGGYSDGAGYEGAGYLNGADDCITPSSARIERSPAAPGRHFGPAHRRPAGGDGRDAGAAEAARALAGGRRPHAAVRVRLGPAGRRPAGHAGRRPAEAAPAAQEHRGGVLDRVAERCAPGAAARRNVRGLGRHGVADPSHQRPVQPSLGEEFGHRGH